MNIQVQNKSIFRVVESKSNKYKKGQYVVGEFGWRTYSISDGSQNVPGFPAPWSVPDLEDLPLSLPLGILGMPG